MTAQARTLWVWLFSACVGIVALASYLFLVRDLPDPTGPISLSLPVLVVLFAVAESAVVHVMVRRGTYSISLTEIPLVVGLYLAAPAVLVVAHVLGNAVSLVLHRRQGFQKIVFNLCQMAMQSCVVLVVFQAIRGTADPSQPRAWAAAFVAVLAAAGVSTALISVVLTLTEETKIRHAHLFMVGNVAMMASTSLGLMIGIVAWMRPVAALLLIPPAALLFLAYRAYTHQRREHESLEKLYESTRVLQRSLGEKSVVEALLVQAKDMLRASMAEIILVEKARSHCGFRAVLDGDGFDVTEDFAPDPTAGVWARVAAEGQGVLVPRPIKNERLQKHFATMGIRDAVVVPLQSQDGYTGTLLVGNRDDDVTTFSEQDLKLLMTLSTQAGLSLEKGRLVESIQEQAARNEYLAQHDSLTDLYNRSYFRDQVQGAIDAAAPSDAMAVFLLDLDRFKEINDTLGHQIGDHVLEEVAKRLRFGSPEGAIVARLGGDEFAIFLPGIPNATAATKVADQIVETLRIPVWLDEVMLDVTGSIGIALFPQHGGDADTLMQRADVAMYLAKEVHSSYELYGPERDNYSPGRLALVGELRRAIDEEELVVYYQPKVDLRTQRVIGAEALVRWDHPTNGLVPPNEFIPLAEHTGLIKPLTLLVLQHAVRECREWRQRYPDFHVAVNLSARSLVDDAFCDQIASILLESEVPPEALQLEITESTIMADPVRAVRLLQRLSDHGVGLAVDDFGTGYSSLSHLKRLPVDDLKIDRSFVMGMESGDENDAIIVRSTIDLGRNLGLRVVAEGIETPSVMETLQTMGCDIGQGYHFSRPMPAADLARWLTQRSAAEVSPDLTIVRHRVWGVAP
ncbi:MAG TPA: GGDEF domain-containing protein [Actinomycetota bacterium]|nr:GGDEF domain-containing protein [Actinomycetota bacterium]